MNGEENDNAFCEKIISEINLVFQKDPDLSSFEIISMTSNQNKSPVIHMEHNLGLESWCIKYVYVYAHQRILQCIKCSKLYCTAKDLIKYLNVALLLNPDVATFWNTRRTLTEKNQLNSSQEFQFSAIVLSIKPKSNEAFAYRRWLYLFQSAESIDWTIELSLCDRCADKNKSNYHAWSHRQWVLDKADHLLKFEIYKTEKHLRKNVHDYSCYHHRQFVLRKLYEQNYFEPEETHFHEITKLATVIHKNSSIKNLEDLVNILVPNVKVEQMNENKLSSFLFCVNFAASDIKLSEELNHMFGESIAFEAHRRAMLQFIVEAVRHANSTNSIMIDCWQPSSKLIRVDDKSANDTLFITNLKSLELNRNSSSKWCNIFLD